jgi:molybdopterin converting factor small subunit
LIAINKVRPPLHVTEMSIRLVSVQVRLFAAARDLVGREWVQLTLPEPATVGVCRRELVSYWPTLAPLLARCRIAVNHEFVGDDESVPQEAIVAVLPPVGGG